MLVEHRITVFTPPGPVFQIYADVPNWPRWDPDTKAATLGGPFTVGSRGTLTPTKGNTVPMVLTFADPARGFTVESRIPLLLRMVFEHELIARGAAQTEVVHPGDTLRTTVLADRTGFDAPAERWPAGDVGTAQADGRVRVTRQRHMNLPDTHPMPLTIRPMLAADLPSVGALFDQYRQFYQQAPDPALARRFMAHRFEHGESVVLVAQAPDGDLVGFCQMYPSFCSVEAAPIYTLYDLFVSPQARDLGAGRQLLLAAEARAAADGMVRMDLTTARTNLKAQSLYGSLGWVQDNVFLAYSRRVALAPST